MATFSNVVISTSIHDHGVALDKQNKKLVQCRYCKKTVGGFDRLKLHIGGVSEEVASCSAAPINVREIFMQEIMESKCTLSGSHHEQVIAGGKRRMDVGSCEIGIDVGKRSKDDANSLSFGRMIKEVTFKQGEGETERIPNLEVLQGRISEERLHNVQENVSQIRETWTTTGCTILIDEWKDENGRCLVNFLAHCPAGTIYLQSCDVTDTIGNNDALQNLLDDFIHKVGVRNVVQIMACSTSSLMFDASKQIVERHLTIFWTVSASDCIGLMLEKIAAKDGIAQALDQTEWLQRFVHTNGVAKKVFGDFQVKLSKMSSANRFLILEGILLNKDALKEMFASLEWKSSIWSKQMIGRKAARLVKDSSFWKGVKTALKATSALLRSLDIITDDSKPSNIGFIYDTMDQIKEAIQKEFKRRKSRYLPIWKLVDHIWDDVFHSPLHAAAYYLNPSFFYTKGFNLDNEVWHGLMCCIIRMEKDQHIQHLISQQVDKYNRAAGDFQNGCAADRIKDIHPVSWWKTYGEHCPELQRLAIRILSQTCDGAVRHKLDRKAVENVLGKGMDPVDQGCLRDSLFVGCNLRLAQLK